MKRLIMMAMILFLATPLFAQEALTETELEWLETVQAAMSNTMTQTSYTASGTMSLAQQIVPSAGVQGMAQIDQVTDQTMTGQVVTSATGEIAVSMLIDQNIGMTMPGLPETSITQTLEIIVVDETLYMRFSKLSPELTNIFPEGWINLNENPDAFPGSNMIVADQYTAALRANLALQLTEDLVLSITEGEATELEGQTLRVFEIELNAAALFATDTMGAALGMFDFSTLGVDVEDAQAVFGEKMQMTLVLHIGVEDNLVHYQESYAKVTELDMSRMLNQTAPVYLSQEITTQVSYTDFNAPITIEAPTQE